jgi:lipopolysaccharide transport system ATP-binding protein
MGQPAIKVVGLCKQYRLGIEERSRRFRNDTLSETVCRYLGRKRNAAAGELAASRSPDFLALDDVCFEVEPGEAVGIVGRNGSGKSTLLKILSRITEPTGGYAEIAGRVGSLLEVGTGFHPQLSGRENVYLNGAILGMTQAEVKSKFDEIVDFAGVERFLDTPVKNYSSGMYTRLAFAVAAYLDTEILIVDEVLAVGDAEFQKKCLGKMQSVASRDGRTVLFVSHNMAAVSELTQRCVLLEGGKVAFAGDTARAIEDYLGSADGSAVTVFDVESVPRKLSGSLKVKLTQLRFERRIAHFAPTDDFVFSASIRALQDASGIQVSVTILTGEGIPVGNSHGAERFSFCQGESRNLKVALPCPSLAPGRYYCRVALGQGTPAGAWRDLDAVSDTLNFEIVASGFADSARCAWSRGWGSVVFPRLRAEFTNEEVAPQGGQPNRN